MKQVIINSHRLLTHRAAQNRSRNSLKVFK